MSEQTTCELCGEPMPVGEEMFKFHGYSGSCPKPPLPRKPVMDYESLLTSHADLLAALKGAVETIHAWHGDVAWKEYQSSPEMGRINRAIERAEAPAR